jgi:hypothetical protein
MAEWEAFQASYSKIMQKMETNGSEKREVFAQKAKADAKETTFKVSTMTIMYYLNAETGIEQQEANNYALRNIPSLVSPGTPVARMVGIKVPKRSKPTSSGRVRRTGFCYSTTYLVNVNEKAKNIAIKVFGMGMTGVQSDKQGESVLEVMLMMLNEARGNKLKQMKTQLKHMDACLAHIGGKETDSYALLLKLEDPRILPLQEPLRAVRRQVAMINCSLHTNWAIRRQTLVDLLRQECPKVWVAYNPSNYPAVKIKLLCPAVRVAAGAIPCCSCPETCLISSKACNRTCVCVTVTVFRSGAFNVCGAQSWEHVDAVTSWISQLLNLYQPALQVAAVADDEKPKPKPAPKRQKLALMTHRPSKSKKMAQGCMDLTAWMSAGARASKVLHKKQ